MDVYWAGFLPRSLACELRRNLRAALTSTNLPPQVTKVDALAASRSALVVCSILFSNHTHPQFVSMTSDVASPSRRDGMVCIGF